MVLDVEKNSEKKPDFGSGGWEFESFRARQGTPSPETEAAQASGILNGPRGEKTAPGQFLTCGRIVLPTLGKPL